MPPVAASYSGVINVTHAYYALGRGFSVPGKAQITCTPQNLSALPLDGTLTIECGGIVTIPNMRTDVVSAEFTTNRQVYKFYTHDERWRWANINIDLAANLPRPSGNPGLNFVYSARALCEILALHLNINYDFQNVPDTLYPPVYWKGENVARALEELLAKYGLEPVFNPITRFVYGVVPGQGVPASLDETHVVEEGSSADRADGPAALRLIGPDILVQDYVALLAVGYDPADGLVKPIADLSYAPDDGWELLNPEELDDATWTDEERQAAQLSVYKWYRVAGFTYGDFTLTGNVHNWSVDNPLELQPSTIQDILPIQRYLVTTSVDSNGHERRIRPYISGIFRRGGAIEVDELSEDDPYNTDSSEVLEGVDFQIDHDEGIVRFPLRIYRVETRTPKPARLWLYCAFSIRSPQTNLKQYYYFQGQTNITGGYGIKGVQAPELSRYVINAYPNGDPLGSPSKTDNAEALNTIAQDIGNLVLLQYQDKSSLYQKFRHIHTPSPSGILRQIVWSASKDRSNGPYAYTSIVYNSDREPALLRESQRDRINAALQIKDDLDKRRTQLFFPDRG